MLRYGVGLMMKISTKGRYALRLMIEIGRKEDGAFTTLREVAERQHISMKYLEQLVGNLTRAKLIIGHRGIHGGYSLARDATAITAGDILRASEGGTAPVACLEEEAPECPRRPLCDTIDFWEGLDNVIEEYVDSVTLDDLVKQNKKIGDQMVAQLLMEHPA